MTISSGAWLVSTTTIYVVAAIITAIFYKSVDLVYIQLVWLAVTALPLVVPMQKIVRMDPLWVHDQGRRDNAHRYDPILKEMVR